MDDRNVVEGYISEGKEILQNSDYKEAEKQFDEWKAKIMKNFAKENFISQLRSTLHYVKNEYSLYSSHKMLKEAVSDTLEVLCMIDCQEEKKLSEKEALIICESILQNFTIFIKELFQKPTHKSAGIPSEMWNQIVIGNEYDVQRILYAQLRSVFTDVRAEVVGDNGYKGVRADLRIEKYDITIEVKCSRPGMTERKLSEELGADGFQYGSKHILMFVYDKENIVENPEAFAGMFKRDAEKDGKRIRLYIAQNIRL